MSIVYYPVISQRVLISPETNWLNESSYFYYPYGLISYAYLKDNTDLINYLASIRDKVNIMIDSSGFQILSLGIRPNPKDVVVLSQKVGKIGFIVDHPPYTWDKKVFSSKIDVFNFEKFLSKTKEDSEVMLKELRDDSFSLYGVIHGSDDELRHRWFSVIKDDRYKGYALGPKPPYSVPQIYYCLNFARNNEIRRVHLFGTSGMFPMAAIYWFTRKFGDFDLLSFDSSTPIYYAIQHRYLSVSEFDLKRWKGLEVYVIGKKGITIPKLLKCDCAACRQGVFDKFVQNRSLIDTHDRILVESLSIHNLYVFIRIIKMFENSSLGDLESFLRRKVDLNKLMNSKFFDEDRYVNQPLL